VVVDLDKSNTEEEEVQGHTEADGQIVPISSIRVIAGIDRFPIHRLARKGSIKIDLSDASQQGETKWKVSYNSEYGQPGPLAYKLDSLIINRRIEEAPRPIPRILKLGSLSDICRELGITQGKNIVSIKTALHQNASAYITASIKFRAKDGSEKTLESGFSRYSVILTGEKLPDGRKADGVYILLNDVYMSVINGAMTRPLDYDYLRSLPPGPQRFYELLSYQMYAALKYDRPRAKLTYSEFCSHAPQTRHLDWESVRSQMTKIHRPHRESGYIAKVDYQQTTDKDGNADWLMFYQPGPKARAEFRSFTKRGGPREVEIEQPDATPLLTAMEPPLVRELVSRGVTPAKADELVSEHSEEKIAAQIERLDWQLEKKPGKIDDPAAYLVGAIIDDYAPPKGFVSKAERQRRAEAKQAKEKQADGERRKRLEAEARERKEKQEVQAYWDSLTPQERDAIDQASIAEADPDALAMETGPLKRLGQQLRRDQYIRRLLNSHSNASLEQA
jgi:hypothetical protein